MNSPFVTSVAVPKPVDFGKDDLSKYLEFAHNNIYANFINCSEDFNKLQKLDGAFKKIVENISNQDDIVFGLLMMRCHSSFLNAIRILLSGAIPETYILLRSTIEASLYCLHMDGRDDLWNIWLNRHQSDVDLTKCRNEFSYKNIKKSLHKKDFQLCKVIDILYEGTINFGAHPNEMAVTAVTKLDKSNGNISFSTSYLLGDSLQYRAALKYTLQVGVGVLSIFELMRDKRFLILGINEIICNIKVDL